MIERKIKTSKQSQKNSITLYAGWDEYHGKKDFIFDAKQTKKCGSITTIEASILLEYLVLCSKLRRIIQLFNINNWGTAGIQTRFMVSKILSV